eukprot:7466357-Karenia_brevis.AAC.1
MRIGKLKDKAKIAELTSTIAMLQTQCELLLDLLGDKVSAGLALTPCHGGTKVAVEVDGPSKHRTTACAPELSALVAIHATAALQASTCTDAIHASPPMSGHEVDVEVDGPTSQSSDDASHASPLLFGCATPVPFDIFRSY